MRKRRGLRRRRQRRSKRRLRLRARPKLGRSNLQRCAAAGLVLAVGRRIARVVAWSGPRLQASQHPSRYVASAASNSPVGVLVQDADDSAATPGAAAVPAGVRAAASAFMRAQVEIQGVASLTSTHSAGLHAVTAAC